MPCSYNAHAKLASLTSITLFPSSDENLPSLTHTPRATTASSTVPVQPCIHYAATESAAASAGTVASAAAYPATAGATAAAAADAARAGAASSASATLTTTLPRARPVSTCLCASATCASDTTRSMCGTTCPLATRPTTCKCSHEKSQAAGERISVGASDFCKCNNICPIDSIVCSRCTRSTTQPNGHAPARTHTADGHTVTRTHTVTARTSSSPMPGPCCCCVMMS